ncbi:MAG: hypothetical protein QXD04_04380 [Candidatus Bathyarchaeia archaeon]
MSEEDYEEDEEWGEDTGCSIEHPPDEVCPECCSFGGAYQPGVEECEFCPWRDFCEEEYERGDMYELWEEEQSEWDEWEEESE